MTTTSNYGFFLPTDDDSMADVNGSFNNSWTALNNVFTCPVVGTLPITDFSYTIGSRVYHSTLKSVFILIAQSALWGNFWRPVETKYGPWIQPGNSIISDPATYKFGTTPINYRLTNTGKFIIKGSVDTVAATGYPNAETSFSPAGLVSIPVTVAPAKRSIFMGAGYPATASTTKPTTAQLTVRPDGSFSNVVYNSFNTVTGCFYDGWEWVMGYGSGYGPDA